MWWPFTDLGPHASPAPTLTPVAHLREIYHYRDAVCRDGRHIGRITVIFDNDRHTFKIFPPGVCGAPATAKGAK